MPSVDLSKFAVDADRGFLPPYDPLPSLPRDVALLDELGRDLPALLDSGRLRSVVEKLSPSDVSRLRGAALQRARMIYAFLASAYVHARPGQPAKKIPKGVAMPLYELSARVEMPPVLSYDVYALHNWRRKDANGPTALENLNVLQTFVDLADESWFILVHIEVEAEAAPAIRAIGPAQQALVSDDPGALSAALEVMARRLEVMTTTLTRMYEGNDPNLYFKSFRPYLMGFDGVVYEGVVAFDGKSQSFAGETAAQSSVIPCFDGALGVRHQPTHLTDYIAIMQQYVPRPHREFIRAIVEGPSIREYVTRSGNRRLVQSYNSCLDALAAFRGEHLALAETYIHSKVTDPKGTGGTPFMLWLTQLRDETLQHKIP